MADSPSIDAFARMRVSQPTTLFDGKQVTDSGSLYWSTKTVGNATSSFQQVSASSLFTLSGSGTVLRQTKRRFGYQSGKSQLIVCTGNFININDPVDKRVGYFDNNNGIFFHSSASTFNVGLRKNGVDTIISQSSWNLDIFNGSGSSGRIIDPDCSQIYFFDIEWLGVGRVRYGTYQAGLPYYVHQITNVNILDDVYMSNPNLPVRYEISSSNATWTGSMRQICSTVISEGGADNVGSIRSVDTGTVVNIAVATTTPTSILAIRLDSTKLSNVVFPTSFSTINLSGNSSYLAYLAMNPTTSSNFSWQSIPDSAVQFSTGSVVMTNIGTKIASTIVSSVADQITIPLDPSIALGSTADGVSDIIVIGVTNFGATSQNFAASLNYKESQ